MLHIYYTPMSHCSVMSDLNKDPKVKDRVTIKSSNSQKSMSGTPSSGRPSTSQKVQPAVALDNSGVDFTGIRSQLSIVTPSKRKRPLSEQELQGESDVNDRIRALWQKLFEGHDIEDGEALTMLLDGMSMLKAKLESLHCTSAACGECRKGVTETAIVELQSKEGSLQQQLLDRVVNPVVSSLAKRLDELDRNSIKEAAFTRRVLNCGKTLRAGHSLNEETLCGSFVDLIKTVISQELCNRQVDMGQLSIIPRKERSQGTTTDAVSASCTTSTPKTVERWEDVEDVDAQTETGVCDASDPKTYRNTAGVVVRDCATITTVQDVYRNIAKGAVLYMHDPCIPSLEFEEEYRKMTLEPRGHSNFARAAVLAYKSEVMRRKQKEVAENAGTLVVKKPDGTYQVKVYHDTAVTASRPVLVQQAAPAVEDQGVQLDQSFDWKDAPIPQETRVEPANRGYSAQRGRGMSRARPIRNYQGYGPRGGQPRGRRAGYM